MARRNMLDGEGKTHRTKRVALTQHKIGSRNNNNNVQGPASRTRSSKKRKPYDDELAPPNQMQAQGGGGKLELDQDHQADIDLWSNVSSKPWIPEKRVFELILDTLQRRDTHEIFAEPVDRNEVEDYYKIIKEPMDFGTMRAKLHEGMYESLEHFERDIFLITKNAMCFNSSDSIYFREARVIDELANEVFRVLRTQPESFESEFFESRLRSSTRRYNRDEAGNSLLGPRPKLARKAKSMPSSSRTLTNVRRRASGGRPGGSSLDAKDCGGSDDRGSSRPIEADKRCAYKPLMSRLDENESTISLVSSNGKQLERVIQRDIGYGESLMSFVKDLGPVVKAIAGKKLLGSDFPIESCSSRSNHSQGRARESVQSRGDAAIPSRVGFGLGDQVSLPSSFLGRARDDPTKMTERPLELDFLRNRPNSSPGNLREDDRVTFGFPFLDPRLGQTNAFRRLASLQQSSGF